MTAGRIGAYTKIARCRACGDPESTLRELLRMDAMPLAGVFCPTADEARAAERYPLTWVQCSACSLVQVLEDIDDAVLYSHYKYGSSTVPGLVRHFDAYARFLRQRFGDGPRRVLEIGCNDGVLLTRLPRAWSVTGVDPSDVARASRSDAYELLNEPFTAHLAGEHPDAGQFDVVTASNALAHMSDIRDVLVGVELLLRPDGEFFVEVHDLGATLRGAQWDTIYHEHKVEWSPASLAACAGRVGLAPVYEERLPLHGGLLRAGFKKTGVRSAAVTTSNAGIDVEPLRTAYQRRRESSVYRTIDTAVRRGRSVSAYGASGRANVWFNQLPELRIAYVVDDSPLRCGRWLPGVVIEVVGSARLEQNPTDLCVITAWNYAQDIKRNNPGYSGEWLQTFGAA